MNTVITGGSKGIGKAIALKFAAEGHNLAICARNMDDLQLLKKELTILNHEIRIMVMSVDIGRKEDIKAFAVRITEEFGTVDVLVNNGGIFLPGQIIAEKEGTLEKLIEINLYSAYNLTRALISNMMEKKSGHIFNMCSVASKEAYPNGGSYSISKFALLGFSKGLREELKDAGIKVTAIIPGATWSDSWAGVDLPYERLMEAKDIAEIIWSAYKLGPSAVVEEIVVRPQKGDL